MPKADKMARKGQKYYAVRVGRTPGVYDTWEETEKQVRHFPGALHKSFPTFDAAKEWIGTLAAHGFSTATSVMRRFDHLWSPYNRHASPRQTGRPAAAYMKSTSTSKAGISYPRSNSDPSITSVSSSTEAAVSISSPPRVRKSISPPKLKATISEPSFISFDSHSRSPSPEPTAEKDQPVLEETALSPQQHAVLKRIMAGDNFFFNGSAGTGKSVLLRALITAFKQRQKAAEFKRENGLIPEPASRVQDWKLAVTASTGMAAVNIGGCTLHSWASIGLGEQPKEKLLQGILIWPPARERWETTQSLVVDEISMIDGVLFDKLEWIGRKVRGNEKPFGGLQIILSGDFFQLPPVFKADRPQHGPKRDSATFAFDAESWSRVIPSANIRALTRVFRQKENDFVRILESMRKGQCDDEASFALKACQRVVRYEDGGEPVGLYPQKNEVNTINNERLNALTGPLKQYHAKDTGGTNSRGFPVSVDEATRLLDRNTLWPKELKVKVGAMVMLVTNMQDSTFVNGSTGTVIDFISMEAAQKAGIHIPVRALFHHHPPDSIWPLVKFNKSRHAVGKHHDQVLLPAMLVDIKNAQGDPEAAREQVPLILAWALTIHKSQGQTIERVRVDLRRIFETGQTYVALSRAVSLETLEIQNFNRKKIMTHERVLQWSQTCEKEQEAEQFDRVIQDVDKDGTEVKA